MSIANDNSKLAQITNAFSGSRKKRSLLGRENVNETSRVRQAVEPALGEKRKFRIVVRNVSVYYDRERRAWDAHWVHHLGTEKQDLSYRAFPDCARSEGRVIADVDPANIDAGSRFGSLSC